MYNRSIPKMERLRFFYSYFFRGGGRGNDGGKVWGSVLVWSEGKNHLGRAVRAARCTCWNCRRASV